MNNWVRYKNGNYEVLFNADDGTKIRRTEADEFVPDFAENCDVKITDRCDGANCKWCYEGCSPTGKHGDILNAKWVDTLHPYTELALNGNDLSHPDLYDFLVKLREKKVFANLTVNQIHFEKHFDYLKSLSDEKLIYGLGVSLVNPTDEFILKLKSIPNTVIHTINGILTKEQVEKLSDKGLKVLILGYKFRNRGSDYYLEHGSEVFKKQVWLYENLEDMIKHFKVVSFDNLAIEQLDVKRLMSDEEWDEFFMGTDGNFTHYIDTVKGTFSKNSIAPENERYPIGDKSIDEMFQMLRKRN